MSDLSVDRPSMLDDVAGQNVRVRHLIDSLEAAVKHGSVTLHILVTKFFPLEQYLELCGVERQREILVGLGIVSADGPCSYSVPIIQTLNDRLINGSITEEDLSDRSKADLSVEELVRAMSVCAEHAVEAIYQLP